MTQIDQTAKSVPELKTEGSASFAKNGRDVNIDYSVLSVGIGDHAFSPAVKLPAGLNDETIHGILKWVNGHYEPQLTGSGSGQISLLYAAAKLMCGAPPAIYQRALGQVATDLATVGSDAVPQEFTIAAGTPSTVVAPSTGKSSRHHRNQTAVAPSAVVAYVLQGKTLVCNIDLARAGNGYWAIAGAKKAASTGQVASSTPATAPGVTAAANSPITDSTATTTDIKSADDKIVTAASKPGTTAEAVTASDTKTTAASKTTTAATAPTSETVEKAQKVLDKISMVQSNSKTELESTGKTPANAEPEQKTLKEAKDEPKAKSENAVGIGASVSDKIEVSTINMRSGPASNYKKVTTLKRGDKIKVIGKTSGWYKVRVNGKDGYVYGGFVDYKTPDAYETLTVQKAGQLTDDHSKNIGETKTGERLVVLGGSKDGKVRVQLSSGQTAYINKDAVEQKDDTPQFVP